jgi:hypothetical protein
MSTDNIKLEISEVELGGADWIYGAQVAVCSEINTKHIVFCIYLRTNTKYFVFI